MIEEAEGNIDYNECGAGPAIVLVPGSCSTGAAWRPIISTWDNRRFRCITTSLLGYGGTVERRTARDPSIFHEASVLESVIRKAGGRVHLAGHSFGGLVALAVGLRDQVDLASLVVIEAPAVGLLREKREHQHYRAFRRMSQTYFADFRGGNTEAVAVMIDFYGGAGTFASWPQKVRDYALETTPVNILDWASAYSFQLPEAWLASLKIPVLVIVGGASHPAVRRANTLLGRCAPNSSLETVGGAAHFMISTHVHEIGGLIARHVRQAEIAPHHRGDVAIGSLAQPQFSFK
jgi:pimeloyl-ACP methyl ester carboxylesterase